MLTQLLFCVFIGSLFFLIVAFGIAPGSDYSESSSAEIDERKTSLRGRQFSQYRQYHSPTYSPTTLAPTTLSPTTLSPTTLSPTTNAPTTIMPTTVQPTTIPPTIFNQPTVLPNNVAYNQPTRSSVYGSMNNVVQQNNGQSPILNPTVSSGGLYQQNVNQNQQNSQNQQNVNQNQQNVNQNQQYNQNQQNLYQNNQYQQQQNQGHMSIHRPTIGPPNEYPTHQNRVNMFRQYIPPNNLQQPTQNIGIANNNGMNNVINNVNNGYQQQQQLQQQYNNNQNVQGQNPAVNNLNNQNYQNQNNNGMMNNNMNNVSNNYNQGNGNVINN